MEDLVHDGVPPADQPFELLCEDHVGTYAILFLVDGGTVRGIAGIQTNSSKQPWLAGACVDGL
jgi:hypothetical protein